MSQILVFLHSRGIGHRPCKSDVKIPVKVNEILSVLRCAALQCGVIVSRANGSGACVNVNKKSTNQQSSWL